MKIITITAVREINEPIDDTVFHKVYASDSLNIVAVCQIDLGNVEGRKSCLLLRI